MGKGNNAFDDILFWIKRCLDLVVDKTKAFILREEVHHQKDGKYFGENVKKTAGKAKNTLEV